MLIERRHGQSSFSQCRYADGDEGGGGEEEEKVGKAGSAEERVEGHGKEGGGRGHEWVKGGEKRKKKGENEEKRRGWDKACKGGPGRA